MKDTRIHRYMNEHGWGDRAVAYDDVKEAMSSVRFNREMSFIHNAATLKWLKKRYDLKDREISQLNAPAAELRFKSADTLLVHDSKRHQSITKF